MFNYCGKYLNEGCKIKTITLRWKSFTHLSLFLLKSDRGIFQSSTPLFWIVLVQKNKEGMLFAVLASMH